MNEIETITGSLDAIAVESDYPEDFLENYCQTECLASHNGRETFLVQRNSDGKKGIATCYDRSKYPFSTDIRLLGELDHPGLPHYYKQFENGQMVCIVREYIEGETLNAYAAKRQLTLNEIVDISGQLCDILEVLHSHEPQIVHRDIKPENIIVRPNGRIVLIDFDIARTYKEGEETDTVFFGTKVYAPPEQYGFGQTDSRADIYSFGVLLRWLVTGNARKNPNISAAPGIERIIERCTAFDPNRRYNSITEVRRALDGDLLHKKNKKSRTVIAVALVAVVTLAAGFFLGRLTPEDNAYDAVVFSEPLIEQAVRAAVGKEEGELTKEDAAGVSMLYIYGDRVFNDPEQFYECTIETSTEGSIRSLDDIKKLTGLKEMRIVDQGYVDATGLAGHGMLERLELKHMKLSNPAAIADIPNLREAELFDSGITDVTMFQKCSWLEVLNVGYNNINSLEQIGRSSGVKYFWISYLKMDNVDDIAERFPNIKLIGINHSEINDLSGLLNLSKLEEVDVVEEQADEVKALFKGKNVEVKIVP